MKYILFVVEGTSDYAFYAPIIEKLVGNDYRFKIVRTDMTSEISDKFKYKIGKDLVEYVIESKNSRDFYNIDSIAKVVMIIDIDGCYVNQKLVKASSKRGTYYYDNYIEAYDPGKLQWRNATKQKNIKELKDCKYIFEDKPFELYYNCVNLDHVLSNERNMFKSEKEDNAARVGEYYSQHFDEYLTFLSEMVPTNNLQDSWKYLEKSVNSLKRLTNFYYFVNKHIPKNESDKNTVLKMDIQ